jgi:hypothetical protein
MTKLGMQGALCKMENEWLNIEDIECYYGSIAYPDSVPPVTYYGGPEIARNGGAVFTHLTTPLLYWVIDAILYRVSKEGQDILDKVGLLC